MSEVKNLKNTSWMMVSQVITGLCAFVWTILIARYLERCKWFWNNVFCNIIFYNYIMFMDIGVSTFATRDISRDNELASEYLGKLIPLKILLSVTSLIVSIIILIFMGKNHLTIIITLIFLLESLFMSLCNLLQGGFQAFGKLNTKPKEP